MPATNRPTQQDRFRKIVAAIPKYFTNVVSVILAGQTFTPPQLVDFFNQQIALLDKATNAKASLHQAVIDIKDNKVKLGPIVKGFTETVTAMFITQPAVLAEFGITPRKVTPKTVATKATAVKKVLATRAARHTMGKNQKKDVKGTIVQPTPPATGGTSPSQGGAPTAAIAPSGVSAPAAASPAPLMGPALAMAPIPAASPSPAAAPQAASALPSPSPQPVTAAPAEPSGSNGSPAPHTA